MNVTGRQEKIAAAKHLIIISYDAFSQDNWEMASSLPHMKALWKNGAYTTKLKSVYPTLTYVVHTTMVTGVYPDRHGVVHNNPFQPFVPEKEQRWFWHRSDVKVPTLYDAVKRHNMTVASILWPVTGKASIKYNLPEIAAIKRENQALKVLRNGSPLFCLGLEIKYGRVRKGTEEPYLDDFTTLCAIDTIKRKKPNLLLMHLIELDDAKHHYGTDSIRVERAVHRMDARLGRIMEAVDQTGLARDTVIMVIGDHGQLDVKRKVRLNHLLKEAGLIFNKAGTIQWRAYLQSTGGAAFLMVKEKDTEAETLALAVLENALKEGRYGIERIYSRADLDSFHVGPSIQYIVEAQTGTSFDDDLEEPAIVHLEESGIKYATHGYSPDKENYRCAMIVSGPGIKSGYQMQDIDMVDIAPTAAKILGFDYDPCDGKPLTEILTGYTKG